MSRKSREEFVSPEENPVAFKQSLFKECVNSIVRGTMLGMILSMAVLPTADSVRSVMGKTDYLSKGFVIPEDERTGNDILMTAAFSTKKLVETDDCKDCVSTSYYNTDDPVFLAWKNILGQLPQGTHVRLVTESDTSEVLVQALRKEYPYLTISPYAAVENSDFMPHLAYPRDAFFATGRVDEKERFVLLQSETDTIIDKTILDRSASLRGSEDYEKVIFTVIRGEIDKALAITSPDVFALKDIQPSCINGDLQAVRLPGGKSGLILGRENLYASLIASNLLKAETDRHFDLSLRASITDIEMIKTIYKNTFAVDEVVLLGEDELIRKFDDQGFLSLQKDIEHHEVFHSDMVVVVASDPLLPGNVLAFMNNIPEVDGKAVGTEISRESLDYLKECRSQFESLGCEIVDLPCGPLPTLNYVNTDMFNRDGVQYVIVPQYGCVTDEAAVKIYEERGFKVIKVDMSVLFKYQDPANAGSVHCLTSVLN